MVDFWRNIWKNRKKRVVLILVVVNFFLIFFISFLALTSSPLFCTRVCHSMSSVAKAWEASSHSEIACVNCHVESNGFINFVIHKMQAYKEPFFEITGKYKEGINKESELAEEMPEEHCTVCHSKNRNYTPSEGLKFNTGAHEAHIEKVKMKCPYCHNRVGHDTDDHENHLTMEWCLKKCHEKDAFSQKCTVCHTPEFIERNPRPKKK